MRTLPTISSHGTLPGSGHTRTGCPCGVRTYSPVRPVPPKQAKAWGWRARLTPRQLNIRRKVKSPPSNVNTESNSPPVATGHQSGKRAGKQVSRKSVTTTLQAGCHGYERNVQTKRRELQQAQTDWGACPKWERRKMGGVGETLIFTRSSPA